MGDKNSNTNNSKDSGKTSFRGVNLPPQTTVPKMPPVKAPKK